MFVSRQANGRGCNRQYIGKTTGRYAIEQGSAEIHAVRVPHLPIMVAPPLATDSPPVITVDPFATLKPPLVVVRPVTFSVSVDDSK